MWVEVIIYILAPALGLFMDKMYFDSVKSLIHGYFTTESRYKWSDFTGLRLSGIVIASLGIAYAGIAKDLFIAMLCACIFIISHAIIYFQIYRREKEARSRLQ